MKKELVKNLLVVVAYYIFRSVQLIFFSHHYPIIRILDVGQGDAIQVISSSGKKLIIDGGTNWDIDMYASMVEVFPTCTIDVIMLTHPHADHLIGLNRLLYRCVPKLVMFNDISYSSKVFSEFKNLVATNNFSDVHKSSYVTSLLYAPGSFNLDELKFYVLWPSKRFLEDTDYNSEINNISTVILVDYGDFEALFTGDIEGKYLYNIDFMSYMKYIDGDLELLKVPHHGSPDGRNLEFYKMIRPKYCAISVGTDNRFDHPDINQVRDLESIGCTIIRTDMTGTIEFELN